MRFQVFLGRTVTTFAARLLRGLFAGRDALVVRILAEVHPHVGMAGFTGVTAGKPGTRGGRLRGLCGGRGRDLRDFTSWLQRKITRSRWRVMEGGKRGRGPDRFN